MKSKAEESEQAHLHLETVVYRCADCHRRLRLPHAQHVAADRRPPCDRCGGALKFHCLELVACEGTAAAPR